MKVNSIRLAYDGGTLLVAGAAAADLAALPSCRLDPRSGSCRAEARHYRALVEYLRKQQIPYTDEARAYQPTPWSLRTSRDPFPHQTEALEARSEERRVGKECGWWRGGRRDRESGHWR